MLDGLNKEIVTTFDELISGLDMNAITWKNKKQGTREIVIAYDSETAQVYDAEGNRFATQISHQLCIEDKGIILRTMDEFMDLLEFLYKKLCYYKETKYYNKRTKQEVTNVKSMSIVIYVHNLSFDLTFLLYKLMEHHTNSFIVKGSFSMFEWKHCIQFKDSKKLLGGGLDDCIKEYLGDDSPYRKRYGMWDYEAVRSPMYKLSDPEIEYAMVDVFALIECIKKAMYNNSCTYADLPVSKSTFVRRKMSRELLGDENFIPYDKMTKQAKEYYDLIHSLNLDFKQFLCAKKSFYGGVSFSHPAHVNEYIEDPGDYDLSSEYPRSLVGQLFPMTAPEWHPEVNTIEQLEDWIKIRPGHEQYRDQRGGFIAKFTFYGYKSKPEFPIPFLFSKVDVADNKVEARNIIMTGNRVYKAEAITAYLNDVDYNVVKLTSEWNYVEVEDVILYEMKPLPTPLVRLILDCYKNKTKLKGVLGEELIYTQSKIFVNTIFGVNAQSPIYPEYKLNDMGKPEKQFKSLDDMEEVMKTANEKKNRTTYYLWGVYTASYGHMFLYHGMNIVKEDIRFCDTDSVKYANRDKYDEAFMQYNAQNEAHLRFVGKYWHNMTSEEIDELFFPKTIKGVSKPIGNWDSEVDDKELGTLVGAMTKRSKCYIMFFENKDGKRDYRFTTAGCSKSNMHTFCEITQCKTEQEVYDKKLMDKNVNDTTKRQIRESINQFNSPEEFFVAAPHIPTSFSGKMTKHDNYNQGPITYTDEQGNIYETENSTSVFLEPCSFKLNNQTGEELDKVLELIINEGIIDIDDFVLDSGLFR